MPLVEDKTSPSGFKYVPDQYPALEVNAENVARRDDQRDLRPEPIQRRVRVEQVGPSMTVVTPADADLPMHGPNPLPYDTTISSHVERLERRLNQDLAYREAIMKDGGDPDDFRVERGISSGRGFNEPDKSAEQLKDELMRMGGETAAQREWRKAGL